MPKVYKTPGVYREDIFLQPETQLPTGVPGFVGFAEAITTLSTLPEGIQLPDYLQYEPTKKLLVFADVMSQQTRDELLALSSETMFKKAIQALFNSAQAVVPLDRKQDFAGQLQSFSPPKSYLEEAVNGFFENGGTRCYVARAAIASSENAEKALIAALDALAPIQDLDLVAVPDAMTLQDRDAIIRVQQAVLQHCSNLGGRLGILDGFHGIEDVKWQQEQLTTNQVASSNGTLYYPWLLQNNQENLFIPPCGHVAGIFARSDTARGVFKAPANEEIFDVLDLEIPIDNTVQSELNPLGINCLRAFPGRGIRIWGARTLSNDINWRYINVRRLFLTLGRWIEQNMYWATFEPNSEFLWVRIQRELSTYLEQLWRAGALQGQAPSEAFYVKCDGETNPSESRETGEIVTEIGLAPNSTAEFIIVRIIHRAGVIEIQ